MITRKNKKQRTASTRQTLAPTEEHVARCSGCPRTFTSSRGLKQHLSQSEKCSHAILNKIATIQTKDVDLSHQSKHTTQQQIHDHEENNTNTAEEVEEGSKSLASIHENGRLFGDEDYESEVEENEMEIQFDIDAQDELLNTHESQDDTGLTDTGVRVEVPKDPEIIPEGLGYDEIGTITDDMLDIVVPHSTADVVHSKLIDLLSQFSAPRYAFKAILDLMREAHIDGFDFRVEHPTIDTIMHNLRKRFPVVPQPKQTIVSLERDDLGEEMNPQLRTALERRQWDKMTVHHFDFEKSVKFGLSNNEIFGDINNLVVNPDNPYGRFKPDSLNEICSGSWYQNTWDQMGLVEGIDFLSPQIIYLDASAVSKMGRHTLEPMTGCPAWVKREVRNTIAAWYPMGYIPDLDQQSSSRKKTNYTKARKGRGQRNYHRLLRAILKNVHDCEAKGGIDWMLRIGNQVKRVKLHIIVAFFIGDGKSGDILCGRFGGYTNVWRISRACDCWQQNCSNSSRECVYLLRAKMEETFEKTKSDDADVAKQAKNDLQMLSQHSMELATSLLSFGGDKYGIFSAQPVDLMHAFLEGIVKYAVCAFFKGIGPTKASGIDAAIDEMFGGGNLRSGELKDFGIRIFFTKGISNLKQVTANEWMGIVFCLVVLAMTEEGRILLESRFDDSEDTNDDVDEARDFFYVDDQIGHDTENVPAAHLNDFIELLEAFLAFHAWYKKEKFWSLGNEAHAKGMATSASNSIKNMMDMVKRVLPRNEGNGWNVQKFHDMFHLIHDMIRYGSPMNFDSGTGEKFHKFNSKMPAATAQLQSQAKFQYQSCQRWYEWQLNQYALTRFGHKSIAFQKCMLNQEHAESDKKKRKPYSDIFPISPLVVLKCIPIPDNDVAYAIDCCYRTKSLGSVEIHPVVMNYLRSDSFGLRPNDEVNIFTEYKSNDVLYRAHPNFQNGGSWYDWCMVVFETDGNEGPNGFFPYGHYPTKVLAFVEHIHIVNTETITDTYAIVHSCIDSDHKRDSALTESWTLEYNDNGHPVITTIPVESIDARVLVISECPKLMEKKGHSDIVHMVKPRDPCWANHFTR